MRLSYTYTHTQKIDSQPIWRQKQMRSMVLSEFSCCGYIRSFGWFVFHVPKCMLRCGTNCALKLNHLLCVCDWSVSVCKQSREWANGREQAWICASHYYLSIPTENDCSILLFTSACIKMLMFCLYRVFAFCCCCCCCSCFIWKFDVLCRFCPWLCNKKFSSCRLHLFQNFMYSVFFLCYDQ